MQECATEGDDPSVRYFSIKKKNILYSAGETYSAVTGKKLVFITSLKDVPPLIVAENKTIPIHIKYCTLYSTVHLVHILFYISTHQ